MPNFTSISKGEFDIQHKSWIVRGEVTEDKDEFFGDSINTILAQCRYGNVYTPSHYRPHVDYIFEASGKDSSSLHTLVKQFFKDFPLKGYNREEL